VNPDCGSIINRDANPCLGITKRIVGASAMNVFPETIHNRKACHRSSRPGEGAKAKTPATAAAAAAGGAAAVGLTITTSTTPTNSMSQHRLLLF